MKVLVDGKKCSLCNTVKSSSCFHNDKKSPSGKAYYCKDCANKKARENHAERAKDLHWSSSRRASHRDAARERKSKAVEYLGGVCKDCKMKFPPYIYDFHHIDGDTKLDNPSRLLRGDWERAKAELDKCVLLCANCHRERHYND